MSNLKQIINRFKGKKIMVIGDYCVDENIYGKMIKISREGPIPVIQKQDRKLFPGAAGNVAANIIGMSGIVYPIGVIGNDFYGNFLLEYFKENTDISCFIVDENRETHSYTKLHAGISHSDQRQLFRIDTKDQEVVNENIILNKIKEKIKEIDAIIVADYEKGVVTGNLISKVSKLAKKFRKITVGDSRNRIKKFKNFYLVKPNNYEIVSAVSKISPEKVDIDDESLFYKSGKKLMKKLLNVKYILSTKGERGITIFEKEANKIITQDVPTKKIEVYDVTGAGDSVCAAITLALTTQAKIEDTAKIGNLAGGIAVSREGTVVVTLEELLNNI
jgi:rfaE bifunctional protein kinase chain/domain